eukprot:2389224-Rhodomonas_salina.2
MLDGGSEGLREYHEVMIDAVCWRCGGPWREEAGTCAWMILASINCGPRPEQETTVRAEPEHMCVFTTREPHARRKSNTRT